MARKPIIKTAVLAVLERFTEGLTFSELNNKIKKLLGRSVQDSVLNYALKSLVKERTIEKKYIHDKIVYTMSRQYHKQTMKDFLTSLTEKFNVEELEANFTLDKASLPNLVYLSPSPLDEYEVCEKSNYRMSVNVDWSDPTQGISSLISNDYLLLPPDMQEGIARLILWGYWISLQERLVDCKLEDITLPAQIKNIQRCKTYATEILQSVEKEGDKKRANTERAILEILDVTIESLKLQNLSDFLLYANDNIEYVKKRENIILVNQGHFMAGGERIFHNMVFEKSDCVFNGIQTIEEEATFKKEGRSIFKEVNLSLDTNVWNSFIDFLINLYPQDFLKSFTGSYAEATEKGRQFASYSIDLLSLFGKRKIVAIYLWNIPVKTESEKYSKLPEFESWLQALSEGELSHRIWLFEDETIKDVESAYRCVRRNRAPKAWRIDKESWTLKDLFDFHPKGKDPEFWRSLITTLKTQQGKDPYRGGPVPKNVYYEFLKKERDVVKKRIAEDRGQL